MTVKPQHSISFVQFLTGYKQSRNINFNLNIGMLSTLHENLILVIQWLILRPRYSSLRTNNSKISWQCQEGGMPLVGKNSPTMGLTALFFCCLRTVVTRTGGDTEVRRGGESKLSSGRQGGIGFWEFSTGPCVLSNIQTCSTSTCLDSLKAGFHLPAELC